MGAQNRVGVRNTCPDMRIESPGTLVRGSRGFEQTTITASVNEAGEQIRVVAMRVAALQQTLHRCWRTPEVGFEKSIKIVSERQVRV